MYAYLCASAQSIGAKYALRQTKRTLKNDCNQMIISRLNIYTTNISSTKTKKY
jgi:hypothetical protein